MSFGRCRLCLEFKDLRKSHIIPNAAFRYIFKKNNGRAITFSDNEASYVRYTSHSWSEYLLCAECEEHLNKNYEHYSIALLRGSLGSVKVRKNSIGISFSNVDLEKVHLFFLSIIWRSAISNLDSYARVHFPVRLENEIRRHLFEIKKIRSCIVGVKISRLVDKTVGGFSDKLLKEFIVSPFYRFATKGFTFCFLLEGFFVEIFIPSMSLRDRSGHGVILPKKTILLVPFLNIFDVPELVRIMMVGQKKHFMENKSKISG